MGRIVRLLSVVAVLPVSWLAAPEPAALAAVPQPVATAGCSPVNGDGDQLCTSGRGLVEPSGGASSRLGLTFVRELRHRGAVVYRGDEQHQELDLTAANALVRTGAVLVAGDRTCTFDESATVAGTVLRRQVSNLACGTGGVSASAARAAPATLPTYADYSAVDTAPNGLTTPIRYGTVGQGNPSTAGCTVTTATNPQAAVTSAPAGAVVCVKPGDYSTSTLTVAKAVTVRANGVVKIKNIVVTGSNAVVDGFTVVGGTLGNPNYAIKFSGTGHKIINNLVRGRGITYAIGCEQSAGCGSNVLIGGNTITGVHNFGIILWGGDHITVERNNVFDLFQSTDVDDVDAMRVWGTDQVVRNNYVHDINARKSAGAPHSDCFQAYQSGGGPRPSSNVLYENNYCLRVTGQCVIVQNDQRNAAELHDYTLRGNVCETYGWQSIEMDGVPNVTVDNDYVAGVQTTVLNVANPGAGGRVSSNVKVRNTVLVRGTAGTRYLDGTPADNTANRTFVDPAVKASYDGFVGNTAAYPPVRSTDFNRFYRDSVGRAVPTVVDAGAAPNSTGSTTDVDGAPRVQGAAVDVGPFELR